MYPIYRLKFESRDLEPIDDYEVFTSWRAARAAWAASGSAWALEADA